MIGNPFVTCGLPVKFDDGARILGNLRLGSDCHCQEVSYPRGETPNGTAITPLESSGWEGSATCCTKSCAQALKPYSAPRLWVASSPIDGLIWTSLAGHRALECQLRILGVLASAERRPRWFEEAGEFGSRPSQENENGVLRGSLK